MMVVTVHGGVDGVVVMMVTGTEVMVTSMVMMVVLVF